MTIWKQFVSGPPDGSYNQQQYQQYYSYMQQQQQQQVCLRFIIYQTPECIQVFAFMMFERCSFYPRNILRTCLVYAVPAAVLPAGPGPVSEWSTGRVLRIFCADPEL